MKTTNNQISDLIGNLAEKLDSINLKMSYDILKNLIEENNKLIKFSTSSNLGISRTIVKAYNDWKNIDQNIAEKIAETYVGRNGKHPWKK